jgi:hypothetical protein
VFTEKRREFLFLEATMVSCSIGETMDQILDKSPACNNFYRIDQVFGSLQELLFPVPKKEQRRNLVTEWKQGCSDKTTRKERKFRRAEKQKFNQTKHEEMRLARLNLLHNTTQKPDKTTRKERKLRRAEKQKFNQTKHEKTRLARLNLLHNTTQKPDKTTRKERKLRRAEKQKFNQTKHEKTRLARLNLLHNTTKKKLKKPTRKRTRAPFPENNNSSLRLKAKLSSIPEDEESKESRDDDRHLDIADPALNNLTCIPCTEEDDITYVLKVGSDHPLIAGFVEDIEADNYKPEEGAPLAKAE